MTAQPGMQSGGRGRLLLRRELARPDLSPRSRANILRRLGSVRDNYRDRDDLRFNWSASLSPYWDDG